jgi:uncharacterized protein
MNHLAQIDLILLFFFLGVVASWTRSDLKMPEQASQFLAIFLLLSIGLKGGQEVRSAESLDGFFLSASLGIATCLIIPIFLFQFFKRLLTSADAAALAACYGSVSAITFVAAQGMLENEGIPSSGFMVAVMALMEIPAIVLVLFLAARGSGNLPETARRLLTSKSVVLLLGGFVIGFLMNQPTWASIKPVVSDAFKGVLAFYLLDLGILAQRQMREVWRRRWLALVGGTLFPLLAGTFTLSAARLLGLNLGDSVILAVLAGSASYIAAPASVRLALPQANPALYVSLPLALTFPLNILLGIPLYIFMAKAIF